MSAYPADPAFWVAPIRELYDEGDYLRRLAGVRSWRAMAEERGATVEITAVHRYIEHHIADVTVNGEPLLLQILRLNRFDQVRAIRAAEMGTVAIAQTHGFDAENVSA